MKKKTGKALYIFVSGPYSPPADEICNDKRKIITEENIRKADEIARALTAKGHFPFVPHTMYRGWEDYYKVPHKLVMNTCYSWIKKCDALYFIASSPGADSERQIAIQLNLPIYKTIKEIPEIIPDKL